MQNPKNVSVITLRSDNQIQVPPLVAGLAPEPVKLHSTLEKEGQAVVVVEDLSISYLDDSSNLDCIYCLKGHNYFVVVGFAAVEVYYKRLQHKLQVAH